MTPLTSPTLFLLHHKAFLSNNPFQRPSFPGKPSDKYLALDSASFELFCSYLQENHSKNNTNTQSLLERTTHSFPNLLTLIRTFQKQAKMPEKPQPQAPKGERGTSLPPLSSSNLQTVRMLTSAHRHTRPGPRLHGDVSRRDSSPIPQNKKRTKNPSMQHIKFAISVRPVRLTTLCTLTTAAQSPTPLALDVLDLPSLPTIRDLRAC